MTSQTKIALQLLILITFLFTFKLSMKFSLSCSIFIIVCFLIQKKIENAFQKQLLSLKTSILEIQKLHEPLENYFSDKKYSNLIYKVQILHEEQKSKFNPNQQDKNIEQIYCSLQKINLSIWDIHSLQQIQLIHHKNLNLTSLKKDNLILIFKEQVKKIIQILEEIQLNWNKQFLHSLPLKIKLLQKLKNLSQTISYFSNLLLEKVNKKDDASYLLKEKLQFINNLKQIFNQNNIQSQNQKYIHLIDNYTKKYKDQQIKTQPQVTTLQTIYQFDKNIQSNLKINEPIIKSHSDIQKFDKQIFKKNLNNLLIKRMHMQAQKKQEDLQNQMQQEKTLKLETEHDIISNEYRVKDCLQQ